MSADISTRPSDQRRAALRDADKALGGGGVPLVNNFFPIERYYDAAEKVRLSFSKNRIADKNDNLTTSALATITMTMTERIKKRVWMTFVLDSVPFSLHP